MNPISLTQQQKTSKGKEMFKNALIIGATTAINYLILDNWITVQKVLSKLF